MRPKPATVDVASSHSAQRRSASVVALGPADGARADHVDLRVLQHVLGNQALQRQIAAGRLTPNALSGLPGLIGNQAMQRALAKNRAAPAVVQRFVEESVDGDLTRISDDYTAAVTQQSAVGGQELYAEADLIAEAQGKLKAVGSGIELEGTSGKATLTDDEGGAHDLQHVWPKNTRNKTGGLTKATDPSGQDMLNPMELWADCGKSNGVVIGGANRRAVFESQSDSSVYGTTTGSPAKMKTQVLLTILNEVADTYDAALKKLASDDPLRPAHEAAIKTIREAGQKVDERWAEIEEMAKNAKSKEAWAEVNKAYTALSNVVLDLYNSQGEAWTDTASKNAKINEYATPEIGQGFTISSGGERFKGLMTWNFHWAGVVLKSADKNDSVTLENYAVGDPSVENEEWVFQMYGHRQKAQTFHQQHRDLRQHGKSPTTMTVENVPK